MAFVYWIRLENHTDPYSEGYVGITTKKYVSQRYHDHIQAVRRGADHCPILARAIRKYGESSLTLETLFQGTLEDCLSLENKYRPKERVGWNVAIGGQPTRKGVTVPELQAKKHSEHLREMMKYPWEHKKANTANWKLAEEAYLLWKSGKGYRNISRGLGKSVYSFAQMVKEFKSGWNPFECQQWKAEFK